LYEICRAQQWQEAMSLQRKLWKMNRVFAKYNLAACIKGALELQGYEVGQPLPPQTPLSDAGRSEIDGILTELGSFAPASARARRGQDRARRSKR
jgi:dihydrodipicolinate synthase/N-acetylneuraminate lyase